MKYLFNLTALLIFTTSISFAQSGMLDKNFGNDGVLIGMNYKGDCNDLLIQTDGKIVVIGSGSFGDTGGYLLVRYNNDGTPDLSFGDSERVVTHLSDVTTAGAFAALQPDGKILMSGLTKNEHLVGNDIVVMRYNTDGTLDNSFGNNGIIQSRVAKYPGPSGIVVQPDGKILTGGLTTDAQENGDFNSIYFVRYNSDGTTDVSFGNNGVYKETITEPISTSGLFLQPEGKILIGGNYKFSKQNAFFIRRYLQNGSPDTEFGVNGEASYGFEMQNFGTYQRAIALQSDGKIINAGSIFITNTLSNAALIRFNSDGAIDQDFGNQGLVISGYGNNSYEINDITLQINGNVLSAGNIRAPNGLGLGFAVSKYLTNGSIDSSFGVNGIDTTIIGNAPYAQTMALQSDGKIIVGGNTLVDNSIYQHVSLARYYGDPVKKEQYVKIKRWLHHHGFTWEDKPDSDISYYSVQKSSSGSAFKEVARIAGNNKQQSYEDVTVASSDYNYRVAAVSESGNITYSNILTIADNNTNIKVYPNPVKSSLQIEGLPANAITKITVTDLTGGIRIMTTVKGSNYTLNAGQLTKGNYMIKIESGNAVVTKQFIKE